MIAADLAPSSALHRIAVVDDDPRYLRAVRRSLASHLPPCELVTLSSGAALLAHDGARFDLVVMDIFMPGPTGLEVCARLRMSAAGRCTPVILATSHLTREVAEAAQRAGAIRALAKPYDICALASDLSEAARHRVGDADDVAWLIADHLALARRLAERMTRRFRPLLDPEDASALAFAGLCRAAQQFDPRSHGPFASYAEPAIRKLVLAGVHPCHTSHAFCRRIHAIAAMQWELVSFGVDPTDELVALHLRISLQDIRDVYACTTSHSLIPHRA